MTSRSAQLSTSLLVPLGWCAVLWGILCGMTLWLRPLINTIETRAMTVAWEMSVRHDYLVPSLNFARYTQKPPLLPWMINGGWHMLGVHHFVGMLIVSLFSFGCIVWTAVLARRWWPYAGQRTQHVIWLCFGAAVFQIYGNVIFYDFILCFFVLMALFMLWQAATTGRLHFFLWCGLCLGLGGLSKGPVVLVHTLPVALLAPLWIKEKKISWRRWYASLLGAILLGTVLAMCWAIPAIVEGGGGYGRWILVQQTTQRVVKAFDHAQPWWYYAMVAPALLLPWAIYPKIWQRVAVLKYFTDEAPVRFLLCWIISTLVLFSMISGKQMHYILPLWPAFALLAARLLDHIEPRTRDINVAFSPFILFGLLMVGMTAVTRFKLYTLPPVVLDFTNHDFVVPSLYLAAVIGLLIITHRKLILLPALGVVMALSVLVFLYSGAPHGLDRFTTEPVARAILDHPYRPLAVVSNRYQGDVNYLTRIKKPLVVIPTDHPQAVAEFLRKNPKGLVLMQVRSREDLTPYRVVFTQNSRSKRIYALVGRK